MNPLALDDFDAMFEEVHGVPPFPWQRRLLRHLAAHDGTWPGTIDLPTGAGKTACIDIALFHLAWRISRGEAASAARRIAFVVDRRIVVDEAERRALRLRDALTQGKGTATGRVADWLRCRAHGPGHDPDPVDVLKLRGGMPRERQFVKDAETPTIILSTVDQIGSRLLFRGYGVAEGARPMHAGILGFDTVLLLDEAHIARPFQETLDGIRREQSRASEAQRIGQRPLSWSQLSATPGGTADFQLDHEDRANQQLARRLHAAKPTRLIEVDDRKALHTECIAQVEAALDDVRPADEAVRVALVVNRVGSARQCFELLRKRIGDRAEFALLIGRSRPLDRNRIQDEISPRLHSSRTPQPGERPIVVVATQTIEVGADFDFHVLISEAAPYAALRQRLGRLNRLGRHAECRAVVVLSRKGAEDDPVYGPDLLASWNFLTSSASEGEIDLGILAAPSLPSGLEAPAPATPILSPPLVRLLAQTSPAPPVEPDVAAFLHGFANQAPDVQVVFRAGVEGANGEIDAVAAKRQLDCLPPNSLEALPLSIASFRSWMARLDSPKGDAFGTGGDLESDAEEAPDAQPRRRVLVAAPDDTWELVDAADVGPGRVVVVPAGWGGCDAFGFAPESREPVTDLAELARDQLGLQRVLFLEPARVATLLESPVVGGSAVDATTAEAFKTALRASLNALMDDDRESGAVLDDFMSDESVSGLLQGSLTSPFFGLLSDARDHRGSRDVEVLFDTSGTQAVALLLSLGNRGLADFGDETSLQRTREVELHTHCRGVADFTSRSARTLALPEDIAADLELAARLHDLGKADPRFQRRIGGGRNRLLAKGKLRHSRSIDQDGARHEAYSVAACTQEPALIASATDPQLVLHLVGSHHGKGRPWHPIRASDPGTRFALDVDGLQVTFDGAAGLDHVASGCAGQFAELNRRYGAWGLAYLETLLRLADHQRSAWEVDHLDTEARP